MEPVQNDVIRYLDSTMEAEELLRKRLEGLEARVESLEAEVRELKARVRPDDRGSARRYAARGRWIPDDAGPAVGEAR